MQDWLIYLKHGLAHTLPADRVTGQPGYADTRTNLNNLHPFIVRHWRKGVLGALLIRSMRSSVFPIRSSIATLLTT